MRLAANTFALQLGDKSFDLKPSLRAAFILYERYDGFHNLSRYLAEGSLTTATDLITATVTDKSAWAAYALAGNGIVRDLMAATSDLIEFVLVLAGADKSSGKADTTGKPIPFDEYFTHLFQIGTGWLGWAPEDVWDATPAEIMNAQKGRIEMLKALFGSKDDQTADVADGSLANLKADLNHIGDLTKTRAA
ncbi:phage tail assembly chaperone [Bradyrhizobium sp. NAS80.1]|uniref:phage tail assembly chaperone n=1 Tax=Bradyrhizobium sp. NAS80.1 TaxID=1680159 RepID=UPI001AEFD82B|nr:phage tail assembly chaperone [Bradyrhizobium sp. NAS80.1]